MERIYIEEYKDGYKLSIGIFHMTFEAENIKDSEFINCIRLMCAIFGVQYNEDELITALMREVKYAK